MRFSILSVVALPVLLGCVDGVFGLSNSQCKPVAKSCASSARQAAPCTALFIKNKVKRPTCTVVPAAVTVTKRVTPTTTSTKTITHTVTSIATKSLPTVVVTETHETVEVETSIISVTISTTEVQTTTSYTTTTSTPNYACTLRKREPLPIVEVEDEFEGLVKRTAVPKCCGCFLTSTKTAARQTKTVTTTLPKVTVKKTVTKTTTATSITTGVASTSTLYETSTEFSTVTETATETATETTTETATATETVVYDLCAAPYTFSGRNAFFYISATIPQTATGVDNTPDCCRRCYSTQNCANYMFDTNTSTCNIYVIDEPTDDNCSNEYCPYGRARGVFGERPVNELFGPGPCGGGIVR